MSDNILSEIKHIRGLIKEQTGSGYNCEVDSSATIPCWTPQNEPGDPPVSIQVDVEVGGCECKPNLLGPGQFPDLLSCQAALPGCCQQAKKGNSIWRCMKDMGCKEEKYPNSHAANDILMTEKNVYKTNKECIQICGGDLETCCKWCNSKKGIPPTGCKDWMCKDCKGFSKPDDVVDTPIPVTTDINIEKITENFYTQYNKLFLTEATGGGGGGGTTRPCKTTHALIPNPSTPCEQCGYHDTQQSNSQFTCWTECPTPLLVYVTCPVTSGLDCTNFPIVGGWATNTQGQDECWIQGGGGPSVNQQISNTNVWSAAEPTCSNSGSQVVCWTNCGGTPGNYTPSQSQTFPAGTVCGTNTAPYIRNYDVVCSSQQGQITCYSECPTGGGPSFSTNWQMNYGLPAWCWDTYLNQAWAAWNGSAWIPQPYTQNPYCRMCWGCDNGTAVQVNVPGWSGGMPCSQIANQALGPAGYTYPTVYDDQGTAQANC